MEVNDCSPQYQLGGLSFFSQMCFPPKSGDRNATKLYFISFFYFLFMAPQKFTLKLAWHLDGNGAFAWLFMFLFFFSASSLSPPSTPPTSLLSFEFLIITISLPLVSFASWIPRSVFRRPCLLSRLLLSSLLPSFPPSVSAPLSLSDHSECGSGPSAEPLASASL